MEMAKIDSKLGYKSRHGLKKWFIASYRLFYTFYYKKITEPVHRFKIRGEEHAKKLTFNFAIYQYVYPHVLICRIK